MVLKGCKENYPCLIFFVCVFYFHEVAGSHFKPLMSLKIFLPFNPLFVAFNALGILPIFVSLTSEMAQFERKG
jgi:hypothetical protein